MSPQEERPDAEALGESVTLLEVDGREIFIVGTAHVSKKSVEEVARVISRLRPDAVCVELDAARYETLIDETRWRRLDVRRVLREGRAGLMLASLLFSAFQKRLGDRLGVRPGSEMVAAVKAAEEVGAEVVLADRDIQSTLRRCYESLGPLDRAKIFVALAFLPFAAAEVEEADVERLKGREAIGDAMSVFAQQMPALKVPLIDERDQYLMSSTRDAKGRRIVAVVGAAHVAGMVQNLSLPIDREALAAVPPRSAGSLLRGWIVPFLLLLLAGFTFERSGSMNDALVLVCRTAFFTSLLSSLFVLVAGGGAAAALATLAAAPLTLAVPSVPLGRIAGEVQVRTRAPSPDDAAAVRADMLAPSRLRKNRFISVLLVTVAARLGRTLGAIVGIAWALAKMRH